jgi:hypothetical protein
MERNFLSQEWKASHHGAEVPFRVGNPPAMVRDVPFLGETVPFPGMETPFLGEEVAFLGAEVPLLGKKPSIPGNGGLHPLLRKRKPRFGAEKGFVGSAE